MSPPPHCGGEERKRELFVIIKTYQSKQVLMTLRSGKVHRARKNLRFEVPYRALVEMFQLNCESPIFGYVKGRRFCTDGKVSDGVLLTLTVPDVRISLTEYNVWADYMYCVMHYTRPGQRTRLLANEEFTQRQFDTMQKNLLEQRPLDSYEIPQAVFEEIRPEWLTKVEKRENPLRTFINRVQSPGRFRSL